MSDPRRSVAENQISQTAHAQRATLLLNARAYGPLASHAGWVQATLDPPSGTFALPDSTIAEDGSLSFYRETFTSLAAPTGRALRGRFRAVFVGPFWLRYTARPSIALFGLRNWFGKELRGPGDAYNLVWKRETLTHSLPMTLGHRASTVDGKPCGLLSYGDGSPFPFRHIVDELRAVNDDLLLGMTVADAPLLRRLPFPFLLVRSDA